MGRMVCIFGAEVRSGSPALLEQDLVAEAVGGFAPSGVIRVRRDFGAAEKWSVFT